MSEEYTTSDGFKLGPSEAIQYLAETDMDEAKARAQVEYLEEKIKEAKARAFLNSTGKTEGTKKSDSEIDSQVLSIKEDHIEALEEQRKIWNRRKTCELIIAMWQTKSANSRKGNIT